MDAQQGQPFYPAQQAAPPPRRANPWKWVVLGCGGIVILGVCGFIAASVGLFAAVAGRATATPFIVAGGNAPAIGGGAPNAQGQTASVKNWDVTVTGVERPGKDLVWSQFGNKSTAVGTWVVVVVKMKNTGNQNFGVNSFDFEMHTSDGTKYSPSSDGGAISYSQYKGGQGMVGSQVPPGTEATYYIVFDVSPSATGLQFVFNQDKKPIFTIGNAAQ
jgi:hypothetical protein